MGTTKLSDSEFAAADRAVSALHRTARRGGPEERAKAVETISAWEAAYSLPNATWQQRQDRLAAIAAVAERFGLV